MDEAERKEIREAFREAVNVSPSELERWLGTDESRSEDEAVGHKSGRHIVELKRKKVAALGEEDYAHMKKVVGYVHRHCAQGGPEEDRETSRWRYSLMNWGHDPCK